MPSKTMKQHGAMCAAAEGKSKIGIPERVGKEFCRADKGKKFGKHNATNRMKVRALRECDAHKGCLVAQMETPAPEKKSKKNGGLCVPISYSDHHVGADEASLYQPGKMVDVHAVPVADADEDESPAEEDKEHSVGAEREKKKGRMSAWLKAKIAEREAAEA